MCVCVCVGGGTFLLHKKGARALNSMVGNAFDAIRESARVTLSNIIIPNINFLNHAISISKSLQS